MVSLPAVPVIVDPDEIEQIEQAIASDFSEDLASLDFRDAMPANLSPEQLDKVSKSVLRYLIQTGEGGYKDGVDEIVDGDGNPPNAENNWLWDATNEQFTGEFVDTRPSGDRRFMFSVAKDGDSWSRSFSPIDGEA